MRIAIIDYGAGNTRNVKNAFARLGADAALAGAPRELAEADALVLPGVGAFGAAMERLAPAAREVAGLVRDGRPFLGICLGMQLLLDSSEESPGVAGLGLVPGNVRRFDGALPVPHTGWNLVECGDSELFDGLDAFYAYFVHSYYCRPSRGDVVCATTEYGVVFPSAFADGCLFATQFHPEKSGKKGLALLANFLKAVKR